MDREKYKLDGKSFDIIEDNIKKLQELFPEIVTEGKVDIDKLALLFDKARNEDTEENLDGEERYEFTWKGKKESMRIAQKQSTGTLRPCREDSVNFDETQNLYIEGDNLEVLRALQNSYRGKVKMIYIDPPYNTGNDFVYKDDFKDNIANYKEKMNEAYKTNTNNDGRYHTNWLNMMYPRLKLARNLLTEDGVIFISIDDNEVDNLRKICDEIYGENNFVGETVRVSSPIQNISKFISIMHDYTLVYCKNKNENNGDWKVPKNNVNEFQNRARKLMKNNLNHEDIAKELRALVKYPRFYDFDHYYFCDEKGVFRAGPIGGVQSGNITTKILHPKTGKECKTPKGGWRYKEEEINRLIREEKLLFGEDETTVPQTKLYLDDYLMQIPKGINFFDTQKDVKFLDSIGIPFDFPKPVEYIVYLEKLIQDKESLILDFFSGSSTTAHATMQLNSEDNGKRKFIMVQIPEETDEKSEAFKSGYKNICEIGKERIRRAGKKILEENKDKEGIEDLDIGFKVFKLDSTNLKAWDENLQSDKDMVEQLEDLQNPIKEGRTTEDLVYEIMLKYGVDLTMPIEELEILGSKVYSVGCGYLMICLEDNISLDLIEAIGNEKPNRVVLADKGLTTSDLINGEKILTELGVQDIRTI
ncbi:site-specific DNA-methyltransferase [Clostridium perfringens]|uniref:site-specific DNA-methyltransferase n=1 Tax=Clostridium perfringens TaxID=1502 RepID=UPI002AC48971|nr:site-specific DNA-methyltransferase [Clostridium perfringens]MDK0573200.1 site-specific DNA-methyltransferase [Clostridium perfringens]MDZ5062144.1 site-specific DNA-methyltransferase [Clostridium perfringens]